MSQDQATEKMKDSGILLPYQQKWVRDKSKIKIAEKSRRIGLTWGEAADDALFAASGEGSDVWYLGYSKDMAAEFIHDCGKWVGHYNLAASEMEEVLVEDSDPDKAIVAYRIKFSSGFRITALSSRPTNLRGKQGRVVIDEAAFHDDLPGLLKSAIALKMWGGDIRIISTHFGDDNPFNDLIGEVKAGKKNHSLHRITLDDALSDGLYKRICQVLKREWSEQSEAEWRQGLINDYGDDADEELFCVPSQGSGIYFPRALVLSRMSAEIPVITFKCKPGFEQLPDLVRKQEVEDWCNDNLKPILDGLDPHFKTWFGEDFARSGDLTVIKPLQESPIVTFREIFQVELSNVPFRQQEQILFYIVDRLPRFTGGALDARGNGQYLAEVAMQRYGESRIHQVMLSTEWYREHMPKYKTAFEDKTILIAKSADGIDDHRAVRMEKGVAKVPDGKKTKGRDGSQRHGDSAIAGCLSWYAVNEIDGGETEYESIDKRETETLEAY